MTLEDFNKIAERIGVGGRCVVYINEEETDARLQKQDGKWFVCQNKLDGSDCKDKLGYKYSWIVGTSWDLEKIGCIKPAKPSFDIGDKAIVVENSGYHFFPVGTIVTILHSDITAKSNLYCKGPTGKTQFVPKNELEPYHKEGCASDEESTIDEGLKPFFALEGDSSLHTWYTGADLIGPTEETGKKSLFTKVKERTHMLSVLAKKLLDGDVKAMVKAGYLDSELDITRKGEQAVFALFVEQNKAELSKRARAELKESKTDEE